MERGISLELEAGEGFVLVTSFTGTSSISIGTGLEERFDDRLDVRLLIVCEESDAMVSACSELERSIAEILGSAFFPSEERSSDLFLFLDAALSTAAFAGIVELLTEDKLEDDDIFES